jgi:hypothetical protein
MATEVAITIAITWVVGVEGCDTLLLLHVLGIGVAARLFMVVVVIVVVWLLLLLLLWW